MNAPDSLLMKRFNTEPVFLQKTAGEVPLLARLAAAFFNAGLAHSNQKGDEEARVAAELKDRALAEYESFQLHQAEEALKHTKVPLDEGMTRLASIAVGIGEDMAKEAVSPGWVFETAHRAGRSAPLERMRDFAQKSQGREMVLRGLAKDLKKKGLSGEALLRHADKQRMAGGGVLGRLKEAGIGLNAAPAAGGLIAASKKWLGGGLGMKTNLALGGAAVGGTILASKAMHAGTRAMAKGPSTPVYGMGSPVRNVGYQLPFGTNEYGQPQVGTPLG